ncbi:MAG: GMC oxidoreductase [Methylophilaceae bacterium]
MIFDSFSSYKTSEGSPTVCIIGSGPAGISLALALEKQKISCLIVEAGSMQYSVESQRAYRGKVIGDDYIPLELARLRYFGGSSGHWAGWCRPLDEVDFEVRNGIKHSGWPIRKKDLDPYAKTTESILEINAFSPDKRINSDINEVFFHFSPPVRFGDKYRDYIKKSPLISLLINSPITDIVPSKGKVSHINVHSKNNLNPKISAKYFCLCTGGIENSRLLLWSNQLHNGGVVPNAEALGKYWMEHPIYDVGKSMLYNFTKMHRKHEGQRFYSPTAKFLRTHNIDNFGLRVRVGRGYVKSLIKDGLCVAPNFFSKLANKDICSAKLQLAWAQVPVSSNRIELSTEKDATGVPQTNLFWEKQPQDRRTAETALKLFGRHLSTQDLGRVKVSNWLANELDYPEDDPERIGYHHMGGTRMTSNASEGVVDGNCKVFGVDNLYISGSSVFATGGHANPTYTIVQLALRLGDHIAQNEARTT